MKFLIIALSGIGDALMYTPVITQLKKENPNIEIDALVMFKGVKDMYSRMNEIDNVHYFDFMNSSASKVLKTVLSFRKKYDHSVSIYPSNRKEYNLIQFLIGAKKRAGVKYLRKGKENLYWLNNIVITEDDSLHNVETNIKLTEKLFDIKFTDSPELNFPLVNEDLEFADNYFLKNSISETDLVIGFHAGCATLKNHIKRRWAPEKFAQLGKKLIFEKNAKILIFGGPEEEELKTNIINQIDSKHSFSVNSDNLTQSAAVMKRCNIFVSNDSGLMHIASALQLKVAALIGPTNPNYIHPWKTEHRIVSNNLECAPCFYYSPKHLSCSRNDTQFKCIKELEVQKAFKAVIELMNS
ncbi:MAG: glycosyltransferase family 9 protein [Melioribacteraceae bacterium]|nr:glycosyltransferase family 9 protein [Melioribacteraceae bacterium]